MKSIATILMIIASFMLLGWLASPLWSEVGILRDQVANVNGILSTLNQKKQYQQDLIAKYNSITDEQLDRLENQHLPKKPDTGTLLIAMERITAVNNVELNSINFSVPSGRPRVSSNANSAVSSPSAPPYQELPFSFSVTSSYENFKALLRSLEKHIRLIDIESISFSASAKNNYSFSVTAKTYFRK